MAGRSTGTVKTMALATLLRGFSMSILMTFLPVYAVTIGLSMDEIGTCITLATAISTAALPLIGLAVDFIGRKKILILSSVFVASASLTTIAAGSYAGILVAYTFFHLGINTWIPARGATLARDVERGFMGFSFAATTAPFQIARVVTPFVAGYAILRWGYHSVFLASAAIAAVFAAVVALGVREYASAKRVDVGYEIAKSFAPQREEAKLYVFLAIDRFGWRLWLPLLNSYMKAYLGFSEDLIGLLSTLRGVVSTVSAMPSGMLVDRRGWFAAILASELFAALSPLAILASNDITGAALAMASVGLSVSLWTPGFNVAIASLISDREALGRAYARTTFFRTAAAVPSPWIGGKLFSVAPQLPMALSTTILLLNLAYLAILKKTLNTQT